jgi:hypothetical protein
MKAKDLLVISLSAILSAGSLAVLIQPGTTARASSQVEGLSLRQSPALTHQGIVLSLQTQDKKWKTGDKPTVSLQLVNPTSEAKRLEVKLDLVAAVPPQPMSRIMALPQQIWSESELVALAPNETKTIELAPGKALLAGTVHTFGLEVAGKKIQAMPISLTQPIEKQAFPLMLAPKQKIATAQAGD